MDGVSMNGGLFDAAGMCDNLIQILNDMTVRGVKNAHHLYMVAQGLEVLRDTLRDTRKEGQDEQDHTSEWKEV